MAIVARVEKLYKGKYVSVRSSLVEKAILRNQDLWIRYNNKFMKIPNKEIPIRGAWNDTLFKSKYKGSYSLIDFLWSEDNGIS